MLGDDIFPEKKKKKIGHAPWELANSIHIKETFTCGRLIA